MIPTPTANVVHIIALFKMNESIAETSIARKYVAKNQITIIDVSMLGSSDFTKLNIITSNY
jgi:hypothetical protein